MKLLIILAIFMSTLRSHAESWKHSLVGPIVLTDEIVLSTYKNEQSPEDHNGLTVTNYLKNFDITSTQDPRGCFRPQLNKWVVESTIYIRPKEDVSIVRGLPRWQKIEEFKCREKDGMFNTWLGTFEHEKKHFAVRDLELKKLWNKIKSISPSVCEKNKEAAKVKILLMVEAFLKNIKKIDTEDLPRQVEYDYYKKNMRKLRVKSVLINPRVVSSDTKVGYLLLNSKLVPYFWLTLRQMI